MLRDHCSELIVCSHLRWDEVWQRPQHLISRLGRGVHTVYVEAPRSGATPEPVMRWQHDHATGVHRAWLEVPGPERRIGFGDAVAIHSADMLADRLDRSGRRILWLDTAMAVSFIDALEPDVVVYDVMDDPASFAPAPPEHTMRHHAALRRADIVFTGGRSLHHRAVAVRSQGVYCFPSGVEPEQFARAAKRRPARRRRPVAGHVGIIDERLDLDLVAGLARALPDWDIKMVGPVKIDSSALPREPNLRWTGPHTDDELPDVLTEFDVALMPFGVNDARSVSPKKTLEYLASGLPVVSTRVLDVVADHPPGVELHDDVAGFAAACRAAVDAPLSARRRPDVDRFLRRNSWDSIAQAMADNIGVHIVRQTASTLGSIG